MTGYWVYWSSTQGLSVDVISAWERGKGSLVPTWQQGSSQRELGTEDVFLGGRKNLPLTVTTQIASLMAPFLNFEKKTSCFRMVFTAEI